MISERRQIREVNPTTAPSYYLKKLSKLPKEGPRVSLPWESGEAKAIRNHRAEYQRGERAMCAHDSHIPAPAARVFELQYV